MTAELAVVLVLLASAIAMFAMNWPRMDAVALLMLTALPLTGVITMNEALAGFSDANVVLIAALFVIGDGLVRTGVARRLGDWLAKAAGASETRLLVLIMITVAGLGATMSSTAVTAIFIPVVMRVAKQTGAAPRRLLMPLSVAALISGMLTLVATAPNLVVNSELQRHGIDGFRFFSFTPFGAPILALGIVYMIFARRWLGDGQAASGAAEHRPSLTDWVESYKLADREYRLRITPQSPLTGRTLEELNLRHNVGANIIAIERQRRFSREILRPTAKRELQANDVLLIDLFARGGDIHELTRRYELVELPLTGTYFNDRSQEIGMAEVMLPDGSELVGKTIVDAQLRSRLGLNVIGLKRGRQALDTGLLDTQLRMGDTLLVAGPWKDIQRLRSDQDGVILMNMPVEFDEVLPVSGKAIYAVGALVLVVALMVSGVVPNVQAALIGCLLMGLMGCVDLNSAYRAIDWKTIVLIVGMLPFSIALDRTGGVDLAADAVRSATGGLGDRAVLATVFAITSLLGMFISNTATAVLMAPVGIALASDLGVSPYPFAMIVALAASTAFMTPVASPVNTLVVTPGNYTFGDFVRVGVPFSVIVLVVSVILVPWFLPL